MRMYEAGVLDTLDPLVRLGPPIQATPKETPKPVEKPKHDTRCMMDSDWNHPELARQKPAHLMTQAEKIKRLAQDLLAKDQMFSKYFKGGTDMVPFKKFSDDRLMQNSKEFAPYKGIRKTYFNPPDVSGSMGHEDMESFYERNRSR